MGVEVKITDNTDKALEELQRKIEMALIAIGAAAETNAKDKVTEVVYDTPERGYIRTGNLRNRITNQPLPDESAVLIGERLEYAPYVELGTSRMRPRPFLKPAILENAKEYKELAEEALKS